MFDRNVIPKGGKNEVDTRLACFIVFLQILNRFRNPKPITNQLKTKLESNAKEEGTRTAKEAPMRGSNAAQNQGLRLGGRGSGKRFPRGVRVDYLP